MTDPIFIAGASVAFTAPSGSASASANIPTDVDGNPVKFIRVAIASGAINFKMDPTSATATTNDPLVAVSDSEVFAVSGNRKFSAYGIGAAISGTVTPLAQQR